MQWVWHPGVPRDANHRRENRIDTNQCIGSENISILCPWADYRDGHVKNKYNIAGTAPAKYSCREPFLLNMRLCVKV